MTKDIYKLIAELKLLIGYLGEKNQFNWWDSNFLGTSSGVFLIHPYPRTTLLAQYHGVSEAALLAHDESVYWVMPDAQKANLTKQIPNHESI